MNVCWLIVALMRTTYSESARGHKLSAKTHLDPLVALQKLAQLQQQKVRVDRTFMHFIDDNMRYSVQIGISTSRQAPQDDSGGDKRNLCVGSRSRFPPDRITLRG